MLGGTQKRKDKARSLITKIVNALTAKLEIGGPMASLYLLGNPDHYTNQNLVVFYWKSYVAEVLKGWKQDNDVQLDQVILQKTQDGEYIGLSTVDDYKYRAYELNDKSLYEWIQISNRLKRIKVEQKIFLSQNSHTRHITVNTTTSSLISSRSLYKEPSLTMPPKKSATTKVKAAASTTKSMVKASTGKAKTNAKATTASRTQIVKRAADDDEEYAETDNDEDEDQDDAAEVDDEMAEPKVKSKKAKAVNLQMWLRIVK